MGRKGNENVEGAEQEPSRKERKEDALLGRRGGKSDPTQEVHRAL